MQQKHVLFQSVRPSCLALAFLLALSGCGDTVDDADIDLNSPAAGLVRIGDQMHAQGDDEGALAFYVRGVGRAPNDAAARMRLATLLEAQNENKDAAEQYHALTDLKPDNGEYRRSYGRVLVKLGRLPEAKDQYEAALNIDSSDIKALNGLGITLDLIGDHAAAQEKYQAALEQKPDDLVTLNNFGHSYILAGANDEAIKQLEPQSANLAAPPALRENLAEAYAKTGRAADAERVLKIDHTPAQTRRLLAKYRSPSHEREKLAAAPVTPAAPYANLGSFSTADLAQARIDKIKDQFGDALTGADLAVVPKVGTHGGTPDFYVHATNFKDEASVKSFCDMLSKGGAFCKVY